MTDSTWVLLQVVVAGWTGLFMWGVVWLAGNLWHKAVQPRRIQKRQNRSIPSDGSP